MRNKFDLQLELLNEEMIRMGALIESAIANAVKSLTEENTRLVELASEYEEKIDQKEKDIESMCLKLLLQQQPVAKDLRLISSALKMITDMERIGDQAEDIAEIASFCSDKPYIKRLEHINDMAKSVIQMVNESIDAFVNKDEELARKVLGDDDYVDNLFLKVRSDLLALIAEDSKNGEGALDFLMIAKYLERIGDHATNIAEWVLFSITGQHI